LRVSRQCAFSSPRLRGEGFVGGLADEASPKGVGEGEPTLALDRRQPLTRSAAPSRPLPASGARRNGPEPRGFTPTRS
jgi:hypothetical protein